MIRVENSNRDCHASAACAAYMMTRCRGRKYHPVGYVCEVVQLIPVYSTYSLGDNSLSACTQWDEDLIAEQDSDIIT